MKARLQLPDVTVCAADSVAPGLAARALERCIDCCDFGDAILFSDTPVAGRFRHVAIERLNSLDEYSLFCLRKMPGLTRTEFVLVVQWDGFVVNPDAWASGFLKYDYVGAPISHAGGPRVVGNGGFSLRSRRLLDALPKLPAVPEIPEDWLISGIFRNVLEQSHGVRFASVPFAERFSHEIEPPSRATFGFHGVPNLWRYESDTDVMATMSAVPPSSLISKVFFILLVNCLDNGRADLARQLYGLVRSDHQPAALVAAMARWAPSTLAEATVALLEHAGAGSATT